MTVAPDCNVSFMRRERFALDLSLREELQKNEVQTKALPGCTPLPIITKTVNLLLQTDLSQSYKTKRYTYKLTSLTFVKIFHVRIK